MLEKFPLKSALPIVTGPSREDLALALFQSQKMADPRLVVTTAYGDLFKVHIHAVEREDGSDHSYIITADLSRKEDGEWKVYRNQTVYYRTDTRQGKVLPTK